MTNPTPAYLADFRRATLPELLFAEDVALVLRVTPPTARRWLRDGVLGRHLRIGRRLAVTRDEFRRALAERAGQPVRLHAVQP